MFHEVFVLFGFVAAAAPKLELVTAVVILPQRQTALVAKQAAEIDVLTGGKLRLGVGIGWNWVEYEGLGLSFKNRARRFEEQIGLLRRYWQEPIFTHKGQYEQVTAAGINPLPIQRPIPIWIGGSAEPALKRAAEVADGFFPQRPLEGGWPATLAQMKAWREAAGQDLVQLRHRGPDQRRHRHPGRVAPDLRGVEGSRRHPHHRQHDERRPPGPGGAHRADPRGQGGPRAEDAGTWPGPAMIPASRRGVQLNLTCCDGRVILAVIDMPARMSALAHQQRHGHAVGLARTVH